MSGQRRIPMVLIGTLLAWSGVTAAEGQDTTAHEEQFLYGMLLEGDFESTHFDDGICESIREVQSGDKVAKSTSHLDHQWSFDVPAGTSQTFCVKAFLTDSGEGDDIEFLWSVDGETYTSFLVYTVGDAGALKSAPLPASVSGLLTIRMRDTDRTRRAVALDTFSIDWMYVETTVDPPAAPTNLRTMDLSPSAILMRWEDNSMTESGFRVERWQDGMGWSVAATLPSNTTLFEDRGLPPSTTYQYAVYAFSGAGDSSPSNVSTATTRPVGAYGIQLVTENDAWNLGHDHDPLTGYPGVAFSGGWHLHFAAYDGIEWNREFVEDGGDAISFAYGPNGIPSITHVPGGAYGDLRFVERIAGTWVAQVIDDGVDGYVCTSLAYDLSGEPAIAYHKLTGPRPQRGLWLARRVGGVWSKELVDAPGGGRYQALAFDAQGNPGIAYCQAHKGLIDTVKYAHWNGTSWEIEVLESGVAGYGVRAGLSYDPVSGHPVICHGQQQLRVLRWNGTMWELLPLLEGDLGRILHDPMGMIHVGRFRWNVEWQVSQVWIATWNGASWQDELVDPRSNHPFAFGIALDPTSQQPSVSYRGGMLGITAVKFASK